MTFSLTKKRLRFVLTTSILIAAFLLFVVIPVGGSFLITNIPFRFSDELDVNAAGFPVESVDFVSSDGVRLNGWWSPGKSEMPVLILIHGLSRSRLEFVSRGSKAFERGYGVLLFDLRNHGASQSAYTTLGPHESRDACAAASFVSSRSSGRRLVFWGSSLGAATALIAARSCSNPAAVIADSSFLSLTETVSRHFRLIVGLPSFPIANLIAMLTSWRMGFDLSHANIELAVKQNRPLKTLFIAGSQDRRMPPTVARTLCEASTSPGSRLLIIEGASHGRTFSVAPLQYLDAVFSFLDSLEQEQGKDSTLGDEVIDCRVAL